MISPAPGGPLQTIVVVGHGMVGHRFCEKLIEYDTGRDFHIVTFCEEPRAAYDRVGLSSFFAHRDAQRLMLAQLNWYQQQGIELHIGDRAVEIDRLRRIVRSQKGIEVHYDAVVLATGSYPFVPPVPGVEKPGVFVYRTIEDLERMIAYGAKSKRAAVIGGGLLGLEAAKATVDLGLETHVIEFAPRLMPRQIDDAGSKVLVQKIESLGVTVHLNTGTKEILGETGVTGLLFNDGNKIDVDMVVISAGIRPRDDLAKSTGLELGPRGGVVIDDRLRTSDPSIFAIGEVALHRAMIYGLVAPGYDMADILAGNLCGQDRRFTGADLSTKLKLLGIDVASFGQYELPADQCRTLCWEDPFAGVYKKLFFTPDGQRLLGGILVGDASDYGRLAAFAKLSDPLPCPPGELLVPSKSGDAGALEMPDAAQICSCNNVSKGQLCAAIRSGECSTVGDLKACTRAGTGCGGCIPLVTDLLNAELKKAGRTVNKSLCEHFPFTRQELFQIVQVERIDNFGDLIERHGTGYGCEICKPAVASILASVFNADVLDNGRATQQDTNDRFLANMQRGGLYSIVPRVAGGEITPDKLIVLGAVAKKYGLYTKITGGQRVDLFGAAVHELPDIWEELVNAGFESGHAYGKALRTVKSCVGTTWCRYGVGDSVGFAIRIENRYKGLRSPHKLKSAVSGCIRECAEAQSKDFGLIATEQGYNLYVCGNGGSKPRHADLLAGDLDEETAIKLIDRFLMFYVQTADRLTRTSVWLEKMDGGIDHLREVIVNDKLGICAELERQMQFVVDTYRCEWRDVVENPEKRRWFQQFVNTDETEPCIEFVSERDQKRPVDWAKDTVVLGDLTLPNGQRLAERSPADARKWFKVGLVSDFPQDGAATIKYGRVQIAVYNFTSRGEWFATQNMCPHKNAFVLSRGIVGDQQGEPKVACPLHKKSFSLRTGGCLTGESYQLETFPVRVEADAVYLLVPPLEELDSRLATGMFCHGNSTFCETHEHTHELQSVT
ncbi:MAG: nitrite reductase large subunit NirB [Planctomycetaceae bacterium]|nr:nitrite reductase large subunit NirB [Planctomycetaceae bacterium]